MVGRRLVVMIFGIAAICGCATVDPWADTRIESAVKARWLRNTTRI